MSDVHVSALSDIELIRRSLREPEVFVAIFDRHFAAIYRYAAARLGESLGEDVAQETFLIAFAQRARFRPLRDDLRPWLYGIATNLARRERRAESRYLSLLANAGGDRPEDRDEDARIARLDARRRHGELARALAHLSARDRETLSLHALAGLTNEEIARTLGVSKASVAVRLHRIRRRLRRELTERTRAQLTVAEPSEES